METEQESIGKVSATEGDPTTADEFTFWLKDSAIVAPFDIVSIGNRRGSRTYGQITELSYVTDSPTHIGNYVSSDFGSTDEVANTPRLGTTYAKAEVLSNSDDIYMPLIDAAPVRFATGDEVKAALGIDQIPDDHIAIPAGMIRLPNGESVAVLFDSHFLLGPDGAHLNIGGISGLATKTSYAMFVLRAVQQHHSDTATIIMNVKGEDLLHLHSPYDGPDREQVAKDWEQCGLDFAPFENVRYFYPYTGNEQRHFAKTLCGRDGLEAQFAAGIASNYIYTYEHDRDKIDLLFSSVDDPNETIASILGQIQASDRDFEDVPDWEHLLSAVESRMASGGATAGPQSITVQSWRAFHRRLSLYLGSKASLGSGIYQNAKSDYPPKAQVHLSDAIDAIRPGDVFVVDIAPLDDHDKFLVFGDVVDAVYRLRTENESAPNRVVIFVDELNKYAPAGVKSSPIIQKLIEITERGRSQGMVLFGAQQFKSAVHERVIGNCSNEVYGRTNAIETGKGAYRGIPKAYLNMMLRLPPGHLVVSHPRFPKLLKIQFPRPCYHQPRPV